MRRRHTATWLLVGYLCGGLPATAEEPWIDSDPLVAQTLLISDIERERLIRIEEAGISSIRPVALPTGAYLNGNNDMLGWPVGVKIGDSLLVAYHQWLTHTGSPRMDANSSNAVIVRSTDSGQTWSDPIDIKQFGTNDGPMVLGFANCFGVLNNKVFLATDYGLYRSEDEGQTWTLIPSVLTQAQTGVNTSDSFGPRMIIHPDKGLVIPVAGSLSTPHMDIYSSQDEGATWQRERITLSNTFNPVEPTGFYHDGRLIFLTRNHTIPLQFHNAATSHPAMLVSDENGWLTMAHQKITNISSYRWPDTTDLDFNPVTQRYEAIVTNRSGGAGESERNESLEQTVNLWSISKEDLLGGRADQWRFEATLLRLKSGWLDRTTEDIDAAHPGGAVIDVENGVQHVYVYSGTFGTPTGIYHITRTLDTSKLNSGSEGGILVGYDMGANASTAATHPAQNVALHVNASVYNAQAAGSGHDTLDAAGVSANSSTAYMASAATDTSESGAVSNNDFWEFTVSPKSGFCLNVDSLEFRHNATTASESWTSSVFVRSSVDSFTSNLGGIVSTFTAVDEDTAGGTNVTLLLDEDTFQGLTDGVTFRFYAYHTGASATSQFHRIDSVLLNGTVGVVPEPSTTFLLAIPALLGVGLRPPRRQGRPPHRT